MSGLVKPRLMLPPEKIYEKLEAASKRHSKLTNKFQNFANLLKEQVTNQSFPIQGITIQFELDQAYFTTSFAGRTLRFTFSSVLSEGGVLTGVVSCTLVKEPPQTAFTSIGSFTFNGAGETDLPVSENSDRLNINDDLSALYIGLHFISESLGV